MNRQLIKYLMNLLVNAIWSRIATEISKEVSQIEEDEAKKQLRWKSGQKAA